MSTRTLLLAVLAGFATAAVAMAPPSFAGTWVLNTARSRNLGMMAAMRDTCTIRQTASTLTTSDAAIFDGNAMPPHMIRYDLAGKSAANTSPTGEPAHTVTKWQGEVLVTEWSTEGSIKGSVHSRTERRQLSPDGRVMTLVSETRPGDPKAVIMVFDRR